MLLARLAFATLLPAAAVAAQQPEPQKALLAADWRTGDSFVFTVSVESASRFEDTRKDVSFSTSLTFTATVGERGEDATKVACRLDRLRLRATSPNVKAEFDSSAPLPDSGPLQKLRELTGAMFQLRLGPSGDVTSVESPPLIGKAAEDSIGTDFRTLFSAWFFALPSEPVAVGATWTGATRLFGVMPGGKETEAAYRLLSAERSRAVVAATYSPPPTPAKPGVQFELRKSEGVITIDPETRRIVRNEAMLFARATRTSGAETATSSIVVRAALGDSLPAEDAAAKTKDSPAPKPQR